MVHETSGTFHLASPFRLMQRPANFACRLSTTGAVCLQSHRKCQGISQKAGVPFLQGYATPQIHLALHPCIIDLVVICPLALKTLPLFHLLPVTPLRLGNRFDVLSDIIPSFHRRVLVSRKSLIIFLAFLHLT